MNLILTKALNLWPCASPDYACYMSWQRQSQHLTVERDLILARLFSGLIACGRYTVTDLMTQGNNGNWKRKQKYCLRHGQKWYKVSHILGERLKEWWYHRQNSGFRSNYFFLIGFLIDECWRNQTLYTKYLRHSSSIMASLPNDKFDSSSCVDHSSCFFFYLFLGFFFFFFISSSCSSFSCSFSSSSLLYFIF